ncbi:MAG TPA: LysR family transcriptional regulator [Rhodoblastus sp.]|nr:LysR family transcriptional regulator [Rhodoblastus sp.]
MSNFRGLTWKQLRALAATVEAGSVSGAAKALGVTPPAITTQLKLLEIEAGAPLFDRTGAHFAPTEIGAEFLAAARDVERVVAQTGERVAALRAGAIGSVVFGVVSTAKYIAPSIVASFRNAHPGIRVNLAIGNRGEIVRGLERSEYDVLLMGRPPAHIEVESAPLGDHPHVLIAPAGHRLIGGGEIPLEALTKERFLAREPGSGTRMLMERFLERAGGGRAFDVAEMGSNETIKQSVLAGLGIAIISAHTCMRELTEGKLVALPVAGLPLVRQWFLLHRVNRQITRAADIFRAYIVERRRDFFPKIGPDDFHA